MTEETVRAWVAKFGTRYAAELRKRAARPGRTWHLDEGFARMGAKPVSLWRAVDEHGQVLDVLVQEHGDTAAAERFFRQLLGNSGGPPDTIVTDGLASYGAAKARVPELASVEHLRVRAAARLNNRVEQSHQPTRLRECVVRQRKSVASAQRYPTLVYRGGGPPARHAPGPPPTDTVGFRRAGRVGRPAPVLPRKSYPRRGDVEPRPDASERSSRESLHAHPPRLPPRGRVRSPRRRGVRAPAARGCARDESDPVGQRHPDDDGQRPGQSRR